MTTQLNKPVRAYVNKVIFYQFAVITGLALVLFLLQGIKSGYSALLGGLAYWLPTLFFVWRVSRHVGARAATRFIAAFFVGEAIKLMLTGVLFLFAIQYCHVELLDALVGLVVAIVAFWIASVACLSRAERRIC